MKGRYIGSGFITGVIMGTASIGFWQQDIAMIQAAVFLGALALITFNGLYSVMHNNYDEN